MQFITQLLILCPLVFFGAFVDSIAGGGGLITLTAYYMVGLPSHLALGSNKLSSCMGSITSSVRFLLSKNFYKKTIVQSILFALLGSWIGAQLALIASEQVLRIILILSVPFIGAFIVLKKDFADPVDKKDLSDLKTIVICSVIAFLGGLYDGFFGPGAGTFLIIAHLSFVSFSLKDSMGNSKIINMATNVAALYVFLKSGNINFALAIPAGLFSIAGNYIGTGLAIKSGKKIVRPIMVFVLFLLIAKLGADMIF